MFWKNNSMQKQLDHYNAKINALEREVSSLKEENRIVLKESQKYLKENQKYLKENEKLLQQVTKYKAICREIAPKDSSTFIVATNHKEAIFQMKSHFPCDFYCLDEVDLDILNLFLEKVSQLKSGSYIPSKKSIALCDDFFDFKKRLTQRDTVPMLYALLDIKITSRRFESFNAELGRDELIIILEVLFAYIEAQK
jgi:hypothetical protein